MAIPIPNGYFVDEGARKTIAGIPHVGVRCHSCGSGMWVALVAHVADQLHECERCREPALVERWRDERSGRRVVYKPVGQ